MKFAALALVAVASTNAHLIDGKKFDAAEAKFEKFFDNTEAFLTKEFAPNFKTYVADLKKAEAEYQAANQAALKKLQTSLKAVKPKFDALNKELLSYQKQAAGVITKDGKKDIADLEKFEKTVEQKIKK